MSMAITPEMVVGALTALGGAVLAMKKSGLITFGKPAERRDCAKRCSDHERVVKDAAMTTTEAKATTENIKNDIAEIKENIIRIEEKGDQRETRMEEEFRRVRELLGELSGYVKAMHRGNI